MLSGRQFETVKKAYGAGDPDVLFKGAPKTTAAWPGAGKNKDQSHINRDLIRRASLQASGAGGRGPPTLGPPSEHHS